MPNVNDGSPDVTALYAWLSRNEDGIEGIIMIPGERMSAVPLVNTDRERALQLRPVVAIAAAARGFPARLVRFERIDTLDEVRP